MSTANAITMLLNGGAFTLCAMTAARLGEDRWAIPAALAAAACVFLGALGLAGVL